MSYIEWVKFVVGSFKWYSQEPHDYYGCIKGKGDILPYVTIDVCDEDLHVTIHYRTTLTFNEWKRSQIYPDRWFYSDYKKFEREEPHRIQSWMSQDYIVRGWEVNLLPWIFQISQRAD